MMFHVLGDSGGIVDGEYQNNVVGQVISQLTPGGPSSPQFCYHVGDVVYYTGSHDDYYAQFYEPYSHYPPPILIHPAEP